MNPTPGVTDPNKVLQAVQQLAGQVSTAVPVPTIPSLNYTAPNVSDISSKYQDFLTRASKDPDIVNYYNQLLQQAQGDTTIAENFLETDYQTGVRNTLDNLHGSLQQLGLTFKSENQAQQDSLNKRGIALTQGQDGKLTYGGGGESASEIGDTQQSQQLRQEAEQRSASQTVTGLGQTLQKGITSAGQSLTQTAENLQNQKNTDVANRANTYMGLYQGQQAANAQSAAQKQQQLANAGPAPANPRPGQFIAVDTHQGGYRWNGNSWEVLQ